MSFKLLAIRPLKDCSEKYRKVLKEGVVYQFYNDYEFIFDDENKPIEQRSIQKIIHQNILPDNFYNLKGCDIKLSISAIVGKNGAGKSSINEILIYSLFRILEYTGKISKLSESVTEMKIDLFDYNKTFNNNIDNITKGLFVELYYEIDDLIIAIQITKDDISIKKNKSTNGVYLIEPSLWISLKQTDFKLEVFFYTIIMNYSLYSLNSNEIGNWIDEFFHKNDGYQMPIVINPYRVRGSIDVNNERVLTRDRLLTNILLNQNYKLGLKYSIEEVGLYYNIYKDFNSETHFSKDFVEEFKAKIIKPLFKVVFKDLFSYPENSNGVNQYAEKYLIHKLIIITSRYVQFRRFDKRKNKDTHVKNNFEINKLSAVEIKEFINEIILDNSHVTLKVRQTLNFLRENIYTNELITQDISSEDKLAIIANKFSNLINRIMDEEWYTSPIDYLPPPFFFTKIQFTNGAFFEDLSSGEKHQIYLLNSIIYHLRNIDSVHKKGAEANKDKNIVAYNNINLVLDEIELYYHPEFQRRAIHDLIFFINEMKFTHIKNINILMITHSPFILSDIPNTNILALKEGLPDKFSQSGKTLGANIYDLLANEFFLENGFIGEFIMQRIKEILDYYNEGKGKYDEEKHNFYLKVINLIGDNVIELKLKQLLSEISKPIENKELEVIELKKRIEQLESEIKVFKND